MAETPAPNPAKIFRQIIVIVVIVVGSIWGYNQLTEWAARRNNKQYEITLKVEGTTSMAVITYTQADGTATKPQEVRVPWRKTLRYKPGTIVVVTASNPLQMGNLTCIMLLNGQSWKKDTANSPLDKISCGGIAP